MLQVSAKFGDNHQFCNIKVSKCPSPKVAPWQQRESLYSFGVIWIPLLGPPEPAGRLLARFSDSTDCNVH